LNKSLSSFELRISKESLVKFDELILDVLSKDSSTLFSAIKLDKLIFNEFDELILNISFKYNEIVVIDKMHNCIYMNYYLIYYFMDY
jgi:hypothetical protein